MNRQLFASITITLVSLVFAVPSQAEVNNLAKISELLVSYENLGRFNGAIAIKKADEVIYEHGNGFANITNKIENGSDKIFAIGSISKQFTATAILLLAQEGKLSLDDSIAKYLPYYQNEVGQKVTIYHLLTHTAGIPDPMKMGKGTDGINDPVMKEKTLPIEKKSLISTFKALANEFAPGERYEYSNTGYVLLADIIERTSGESYARFLQKNIFSASGMTHTSANRPSDSPLLVESYNGVGTDKVHTTKIHNSWLVGAAGLYSTFGDLFNWVEAMDNGKILKDQKFNYLLTKSVDLGVNDERYGYGMEMKTLWDKNVYRHDGATAGTISDFIYFPEQELTILIYINQVHNVNDIEYSINMRKQITKQVTGILLGHEVPVTLALNRNEKTSLAQFVGHYYFDNEHQVEITLKNDSLELNTAGKKPWSLYNLAQDTALPTSPLTEKSTGLFELLNTNKLAGLAELFDEQMASMPLNVFEGFWQQLEAELGALKANYSFSKSSDNRQVQQRLIFKEGIVDMGVFFNDDGEIEGIQNSSPVPKESKCCFSAKLLTQENDQLLIDGYVIKQQDDLFLNFTRDSENKITGFSYEQLGKHLAIKQ